MHRIFGSKFEKTSAVTSGLEKVSFHFSSKELQCQRMSKLPYNCPHFTCQQVKAQILQPGLRECTPREHSEVLAGFRKGRETTDQTANICWIQKTSISASLTKLTTLTVWITTKDCGKFFKRQESQTTTWPASWEACVQVRKQQLEQNMEQLTGSKLGKKYDKAVYSHPANLTYMQNTSCEMLAWMNYNLKSTIPGEISTTSDMQMISF